MLPLTFSLTDGIAMDFRFFIVTFAVVFLTGCYRMPTDDDFSLVPTTNNPAVTCEKSQGLPGLKM